MVDKNDKQIFSLPNSTISTYVVYIYFINGFVKVDLAHCLIAALQALQDTGIYCSKTLAISTLYAISCECSHRMVEIVSSFIKMLFPSSYEALILVIYRFARSNAVRFAHMSCLLGISYLHVCINLPSGTRLDTIVLGWHQIQMRDFHRADNI